MSDRCISPIANVGNFIAKHSDVDIENRYIEMTTAEILGDRGRGPTEVSDGVTLELLIDPRRHIRLTNHDEETVQRAMYLQGSIRGPLKLVSGDYTMLTTGRAVGLDAVLTPAELSIATEAYGREMRTHMVGSKPAVWFKIWARLTT